MAPDQLPTLKSQTSNLKSRASSLSRFASLNLFNSLVCLILSSPSFCLSASPITFQSSETQTTLIELYTSEGCSSCPPAETWLSRLKESPALWKDFVPLAFHVDYWDYFGWRECRGSHSHFFRHESLAGELCAREYGQRRLRSSRRIAGRQFEFKRESRRKPRPPLASRFCSFDARNNLPGAQ